MTLGLIYPIKYLPHALDISNWGTYNKRVNINGASSMARSIEQIKNEFSSVIELRKEAKRLGLTHVERDGKKVAISSHGKKEEIIEAISKFEGMQNQAKPQTSVNSVVPVAKPVQVCQDAVSHPIIDLKPVIKTPVITEPIIEETETDYTNYEEVLRSLTTKYYQGFKTDNIEVAGILNFASKQVENIKGNKPLWDDRLFATVEYFKQEIIGVASDVSKDGVPNPSTTLNLRTEILNRLRKAVSIESAKYSIETQIEGMNPVVTDCLTQSFQAFHSAAVAAFGSIAREKRQTVGSNFLVRRTTTPHANVCTLVGWAIDRLKTLPKKAQEWREVALAILIVTGRRPAEVMATGVFKALTASEAEFYGQLKKKGKDSDEKTYIIPCIGDTAIEVEQGIKWLQMMNKRILPKSRSLEDKQEAAKKAHDNFSKYLSEISKEIMQKIRLVDNANWELPENKSRLKPYLARQIYLQIISKLIQKSVKNGTSIDPDLAVTYYSGHYLSIDGKDANAENYLADIVIADMDSIEEIWLWEPTLSAEEIESIRQKF